MMQNTPLILASGSKIRRQILQNAGLDFIVLPPDVDEDALKNQHKGKTIAHLARLLAKAKAAAIKERPNALILASDQILSFNDRAFDKAKSMAQAKTRLAQMAGKHHHLISATVLMQNGRVLWSHGAKCRLDMRKISEAALDDYLAHVGPDVLHSVGCYELEGRGAQLFDKVQGDYFTILGLPLLALMKELRKIGYLSS